VDRIKEKIMKIKGEN